MFIHFCYRYHPFHGFKNLLSFILFSNFSILSLKQVFEIIANLIIDMIMRLIFMTPGNPQVKKSTVYSEEGFKILDL